MVDYQTEFNGKPIGTYEIGKPFDASKVTRLHSGYDEEHKIVDYLKDLVDTKKSEQLEELVIGAWQEAWERGPQFLDYMIENKAAFPKLKHIFFGDMDSEDCEISWIIQGNYEQFLRTFSDLETFAVQGGMELRLGKANLPHLKNLLVFTGGLSEQTFADIIQLDMPAIEYIEIWLGEENYGASVKPEQIKQFLDKPMPSLKHLGLQNSDMQNDVVKEILNHSIIQQIVELDISMGILEDEGAQVLLDKASELSHLKSINCRHHFISDELMKKLNDTFGERINLKGTEYGDDDWKYVEVGE